jgi:membrane-associated phospholipid phosphatase
MLKIVFLAILLASTHLGVLAQQRDSFAGRVEEDVFGSVRDMTAWYDAPVILLFLARNSYKEDNPATKLFLLQPFGFEKDLASRFRGNEATSLGSMDTWVLPNVVFAGRLLYAVGNTLAGQENMRDEYAHAWGFYKVLIYNHLATELVKNTVSRARPDDSDTKSFFSGHTSTAFVTSAYLYRETADAIDAWSAVSQSPTLRTGLKAASFALLYGWASYVGYSRVAVNKHYVSDVVVGAAVGTLIGNLVYGSYFGGDDGVRVPTFGVSMIEDQPALSFSLSF